VGNSRRSEGRRLTGAVVAATVALAAGLVGIGSAGAAVDVTNADRCDFLVPQECLLPFPNDHFTVADPSTETGRRVNFNRSSMPTNRLGLPIEPADYNRNDGFSPGSTIVTKVPGLDTPQAFANTGAVPITDVERSFDPDQPVVLINAATGERQLIWAELDSNATSPATTALLINPAENLEEGTRYIVALRNLRDAAGTLIPAPEAFRVYRDGVFTGQPEVEARRPHFENDIFPALQAAGIPRADLYMAWDFTVASQDNISERVLHIRNDAFAQLGDTNLADMTVQGTSPRFAVNSITNYTVAQNPRIARRVRGQVVVPCYLTTLACAPLLSRFNYGPDGLPRQRRVLLARNNYQANYDCIIPRSAVNGGNVIPARPSLYGHGLFGTADEVTGANVEAMANEHRMMFCATDWAGMSNRDLPNVALILQDLSLFPTLVDRVQQGWLNFLYLGRTMIHSNGFRSHNAFKFGGQSVINPARLFYDGNSQGGILGGGLTAVAPDFNRAVLGVPGIRFSVLIPRSIHRDRFLEGEFIEGVPLPIGLNDSYTNELQRPLIFSMVQMLWDRGEPNGYAHVMTSSPLPNTPPHEVLLHEAFGDHQVANVLTEVEARSIGAFLRTPALDPGRHTDVNPFFGIPPIPAFPFGGSALVVWDIGPPRTENGQQVGVHPPPITNTPPREGQDPHSAPRNDPEARQQKSAFLQIGGQVIDVCGPMPCYAGTWTGP
jgi:hypothetical protein